MLKKKFECEYLKSPQGSLPEDRLDVFFLAGGKIRGVIAQGTLMINEMRANHELGIIETLALGHAYLAAGLMSHNLTTGERVALQIDASGPLKGLVVEANAAGEVRGYLQHKDVEITDPVDSFDLAPFIGIGFLKVTKDLQELEQPFTGQVVLEHGTLAKDLVHYFYTSEQIPTAVALSIFFDPQGRVSGAGGFFLQALPGVEPEVLDALSEAINSLPSLGKQLAAGQESVAYLEEFFAPYNLQLLEKKPLEFFCQCTRERFAAYLASLPSAELEDMRAHGPFPLITTCHNCNSAYRFSKQQLVEL